MNLKDAFRAQNKLQALMDEANCILQDRDNILKVTTTYLRSKPHPRARWAWRNGEPVTAGSGADE